MPNKKLLSTRKAISKEWSKLRDIKASIKAKTKDKNKASEKIAKAKAKTLEKISKKWSEYSSYRDTSKGKLHLLTTNKDAKQLTYQVKHYPKIDDPRNNTEVTKALKKILIKHKDIRYILILLEVPYMHFSADKDEGATLRDIFSKTYTTTSIKARGIDNIEFVFEIVQESRFSKSKDTKSGRIDGTISEINIRIVR